MPPAAPKTNLPLSYPDETRKAPPLTTWWGIGSVSFGALAAAFLPAAIVGGGEDWTSVIYSASVFWIICCLIGAATGIRGMTGRRLTRAQRLTAAAGTGLSIISFVVLTIIALQSGS